MLFIPKQNSEEYNILNKIENIQTLLKAIKDQYTTNTQNISNMFIEAYLTSAEKTLIALIQQK